MPRFVADDGVVLVDAGLQNTTIDMMLRTTTLSSRLDVIKNRRTQSPRAPFDERPRYPRPDEAELREAARKRLRPEWITKTQRILSGAWIGAAVLMLTAWLQKGALADSDDILGELLQQPIQTPTTRQPFSLDFMGETYDVMPVADYELWGLVVSHNNPTGISDIYHDETSVDTRDLCVLFGENLESNQFHHVDFDSGSNFCYFEYGPGVTFNHGELSNNHMITDNQSIRDRIADIHVGDQIHIVGSLVNYRYTRHPQFWRESSTDRGDDGAGACEVIFVDRLEILKRGTPVWYGAFTLGWWLIILLPVGKLGCLLWEIRRRYL